MPSSHMHAEKRGKTGQWRAGRGENFMQKEFSTFSRSCRKFGFTPQQRHVFCGSCGHQNQTSSQQLYVTSPGEIDGFPAPASRFLLFIFFVCLVVLRFHSGRIHQTTQCVLFLAYVSSQNVWCLWFCHGRLLARDLHKNRHASAL